MKNHKYKDNVCVRCGTKRLRTKRNGKDVTLFNGELVKNACVV